MLRRITKNFGRFRAGDTHDYPRGVWNQIASSGKVKLDDVSEEVDFNASHRSVTRSGAERNNGARR